MTKVYCSVGILFILIIPRTT